MIDYGAQSGRYTHQVDVGNALSLTLGAVKAGATYYFVVRSYNPAGVRSSASGELVATAVTRAIPTITSLTIISHVAPPQMVNTTVQWTATPVGGVAPYQYRWFVFDGENWWKIGSWTTTATVAWQPTVANSGYVFGVWARSAGSTTDAPEMSCSSHSASPGCASRSACAFEPRSDADQRVADAPIAVDALRADSTAKPSKPATRNLNVRANPMGRSARSCSSATARCSRPSGWCRSRWEGCAP